MIEPINKTFPSTESGIKSKLIEVIEKVNMLIEKENEKEKIVYPNYEDGNKGW